MSLFGRKGETKPEARAVEAPPQLAEAPRRYGIDDAIQLMRTLPLNQNPELVLLVVRNTLSSMNVALHDVIEDGAAKQERLRHDVAAVEAAIAELEHGIAAKRDELAALHADLEETTSVRDRLELAARPAPVPGPPEGSSRPAPPLPPPRPPKARPATAPAEASTDDERRTMEVEPLPDSTP